MRRIHRSWIRSTTPAAGLVALLLLTTACAGGPPEGEPLLTTDAGKLGWDVWLEPNPPKETGNTVWIEVRDDAGEPVEGADVSLEFRMPAMGAMPEMRGEGEVAEQGDGLYRISLDFPMGSSWGLSLAVATDRGRASAEYSLTVGSKSLREIGGTGGTDRAPDAGDEKTVVAGEIEPVELPEPVLEALRTALAAYEESRQLLAGDRLEGLEPRAARLTRSLEAAERALADGAPSEVSGYLAEAIEGARALGDASEVEDARQAFGEVSRFLVALVGAEARLAEGWHVFECPMTETFPKWMQPTEELENPYMGPAMAGCGDETDWSAPAPATFAELEGHVEQVHGGDVAYYTCSMHPSVKNQTEGTCPICSMDLVPVTEEEVATGVIRVDAARRQTIGLRTARAERRAVAVSLRTVGTVVYDETRLADVSVKYRGWIGRLLVDETGQLVEKGNTLFTLYSPDLYAAQQEYLTALASQRTARQTAAPDRADYLVEAARERLRLWDLEGWQIDELAKTGKALEYLPITSPVTGHVIEKNVVEGASVEPGRTLYRIAGLESVWVEAEVYESELPLVELGQEAEVRLPYGAGQRFSGTISFVYPYLHGATRTGKIRIELPNPGLELKPDMFVDVFVDRDLGERLVVPEEAVLYAGDRSFVFVDLGEGRLQPNEVTTGVHAGDDVEILSGLDEGELVVTSGNFLVAAESRLKQAIEQWQ